MLVAFEGKRYRVITLVAIVDGSGGGFSRMMSGGGVFGGVGRSVGEKEVAAKGKRTATSLTLDDQRRQRRLLLRTDLERDERWWRDRWTDS